MTAPPELEHIAGFRIERQLGTHVWQAVQPELGRRVALRRLEPGTEFDAARWPDRPGIVHAVTSFLMQHGGNIMESQQFGDQQAGRFFMRIDFEVDSPTSDDRLRADFAATAAEFEMDFELWSATAPYLKSAAASASASRSVTASGRSGASTTDESTGSSPAKNASSGWRRAMARPQPDESRWVSRPG